MFNDHDSRKFTRVSDAKFSEAVEKMMSVFGSFLPGRGSSLPPAKAIDHFKKYLDKEYRNIRGDYRDALAHLLNNLNQINLASQYNAIVENQLKQNFLHSLYECALFKTSSILHQDSSISLQDKFRECIKILGSDFQEDINAQKDAKEDLQILHSLFSKYIAYLENLPPSAEISSYIELLRPILNDLKDKIENPQEHLYTEILSEQLVKLYKYDSIRNDLLVMKAQEQTVSNAHLDDAINGLEDIKKGLMTRHGKDGSMKKADPVARLKYQEIDRLIGDLKQIKERNPLLRTFTYKQLDEILATLEKVATTPVNKYGFIGNAVNKLRGPKTTTSEGLVRKLRIQLRESMPEFELQIDESKHGNAPLRNRR